MSSLNKMILIGNLGQDPEVTNAPGGSLITKLSLATTEVWKDKQTKKKKEATEWHRVALFGRLAEIAADYLKKGRQVYIEGRLKTNKWTDDKGVVRYTTEIIANDMKMLGSQAGGSSSPGASQPGQYGNTPSAPSQQQNQGAQSPPVFDEFDQELNF